jgi:hypothetical protein
MGDGGRVWVGRRAHVSVFTVGVPVRRCRECGQPIPEETAQERLHKNVFVWSFMTVFFWGCALYGAPIQGTFAWWERMGLLAVMLVVLPVVALYFWVELLRKWLRKP